MTWGRFSGYGQVFDCLQHGTPMRARVFAAEVEGGRTLEVKDVYEPKEEPRILQAEFMIQESFEVDG